MNAYISDNIPNLVVRCKLSASNMQRFVNNQTHSKPGKNTKSQHQVFITQNENVLNVYYIYSFVFLSHFVSPSGPFDLPTDLQGPKPISDL